ncbi:MAG: SoxR reducing system RseC family protein [Clostridia bacterium]|nr:SoxR reducing system RseC family protein [Clostridia bacterium]MBQ7048085.1 SoxR reducing system RseC family protein [Clostridia bacterium]
MRADGVVVSLDGDLATVSVVQQSACAGCGANCANCHKKVTHEITLKNDISASVGESVWVESSGFRILLLCLVLFIIPPILAGVCCAFLMDNVSTAVLTVFTIGIAVVSFVILYLTIGKKIVVGNSYRLVKKY